ncbi:hypothetical protein LTR85_002863, partial [Meristemomyces frigidus]
MYLISADALRQSRVDDVGRIYMSPNVKKIAARSSLAQEVSEASGKRLLQDLLIARPAVPLDDDQGVQRIWVAENANLKRHFLPPLRTDFTELGTPPLNQPQPDACVGYIKWRTAELSQPKLAQAFSADEDVILATRYAVAKETHFPFLTAHYKS